MKKSRKDYDLAEQMLKDGKKISVVSDATGIYWAKIKAMADAMGIVLPLTHYDKQISDALKQYEGRRVSDSAIAKIAGCSSMTVTRYRARNGLGKLNELTREDIENTAHLSLRQAAKVLNRAHSNVFEYRQKYKAG